MAVCIVHGLVVDSQDRPRANTLVLFEYLIDGGPAADALMLPKVVRAWTDEAGVLPDTELALSNATGVTVPWLCQVRARDGVFAFEFLAVGERLNLRDVAQMPAVDAPVEAWVTLQASVAADADRSEAAAARAEAAEGTVGASAYDIAVANGFVGSELEWLESLVGEPAEPAEPGAPGASAYELAVANGFVGTEAEWLESLAGEDATPAEPGAPGASAYDVAVANGFVGSEAEWLASLQGPAAEPQFVVSATPPADTSLIWVDTSGA